MQNRLYEKQLVDRLVLSFFFRFSISLHRDSADFDGSDVPLQVSIRFDEGKVNKKLLFFYCEKLLKRGCFFVFYLKQIIFITVFE